MPFAPDRLRCLAPALACALVSSVALAQEGEPARRTENPLVATAFLPALGHALLLEKKA